MRGAWVTGRVGWCHTELGVLGGYRRRVTAVGCCRPGTAGIVYRAARGQAGQMARTAGASAAAWARPALAAARRDTSSGQPHSARSALATDLWATRQPGTMAVMMARASVDVATIATAAIEMAGWGTT